MDIQNIVGQYISQRKSGGLNVVNTCGNHSGKANNSIFRKQKKKCRKIIKKFKNSIRRYLILLKRLFKLKF